jgi:hypothetical protein
VHVPTPVTGAPDRHHFVVWDLEDGAACRNDITVHGGGSCLYKVNDKHAMVYAAKIISTKPSIIE